MLCFVLKTVNDLFEGFLCAYSPGFMNGDIRCLLTRLYKW